MARSLTATGHSVRVASPTAYPGATGTVAIRVRPNWNHNDGVDHKIWWFVAANSADPTRLQFQKFSDGNCYIGWYTSGDDDRIAYAATSTDFTSGIWQSHVLTWSDSANTEEYWTGGVSRATRTSALVTYTVSSEQNVGNANSFATQNNSNAAFADLAIWDVILTAGEIAAYDRGVDARTIRPGSLTNYLPLLGNYTNESDLLTGQDWAVTSAAKADHPRVFRPKRRDTTVGTVAGGGSTGAVSLIHGLTRANLTSGRLVA